MDTKDLDVLVDPNGAYPKVERETLIEACGYLPFWAIQYALGDKAGDTLKEHMDKSYGFGLYEMTGGNISDDGTYKYPEDPALDPYMRIKIGSETMYIYQSAIVAFVTPESTFVTRMD